MELPTQDSLTYLEITILEDWWGNKAQLDKLQQK
jgi:hypothetical protein